MGRVPCWAGNHSRWRSPVWRSPWLLPSRSAVTLMPPHSVSWRSARGSLIRPCAALAAIYDGGTRTEAAQIGGVALQMVRDWAFALQCPWSGWASGRQGPGSALDPERAASPAPRSDDRAWPYPGGAWRVRWRLVDLMQWLWEEYQIAISKQTLSRELLAHRTTSAEPAPLGPPTPSCQRARRRWPLSKRLPRPSGANRPDRTLAG